MTSQADEQAVIPARHTPGPWRTNGCYISSNYGEIGHAYWVSSMPDGASEANAAMLAASPTLHDALIEVVEWIDGWSPNFIQDADWPSTLSKVRTALAKAAGGA